MDKLKVTRVDAVLVQQPSEGVGTSTSTASLHLTRHHLILTFKQKDSTSSAQEGVSSQKVAEEGTKDAEGAGPSEAGPSQVQSPPPEEIWIPYSLISILTRLAPVGPRPSKKAIRAGLPAPPRAYPLLIRTRTFRAYALGLQTEALAVEVWESVRACTAVSSSTQLYAFYYTPAPPLPAVGWSLYDFKKEFARQGVGSRSKAWRFTNINNTYGFCGTYPSQMVVPSRISDTTLGHASKYRSKERIPALAYLHWANLGSITRSSQPMVGLKQARSVQDEKLIEAIFTSHLFADPHSSEAAAAAAASASGNLSNGAALPGVYGATLTNLIIDARPTTNAVANTAKGAGTENMDHYRGCKKAYLGIDNIHVMRDSLNRVYDAVKEAEPPVTFGLATSKISRESADAADVDTPLSPAPDVPPKTLSVNVVGLKRSNWLKHITTLLEGSLIIARNVHVHSSHVLIHCSDGWDRTSQLSALAQLMLDPYYRTLEGFAVLIEKDWLSFGHRFHDRCGHLSSGKRFVNLANDEDAEEGGLDSDSEKEAEPQGFETQAANAFWGFTRQLTAGIQGATGSGTSHLKETSPVFHQFLECVWQMQRQFPNRFEFNEDFLLQLHEDLYACRFGTFLNNSERERRSEGTVDRTKSVWDFLLAPQATLRIDSSAAPHSWRNTQYDAALDDPKRPNADMGVILPDPRNVRFWARLFGRTDAEMNVMVDAEVEERRRAKALREKLARSAREDVVRERDRVTDVRVVEGSKDDPVLALASGADAGATDVVGPEGQKRHGAVDLTTSGFDPSKLAYKARAPRGAPAAALASAPTRPLASRNNSNSSSVQHTAAVSNSSSASTPPHGHTLSPGASETSFNLQSPAAAEAAARVKGLFLGGWGRLQDAVSNVANGPIGSEDPNVAGSSARPPQSVRRLHEDEDPGWGTSGRIAPSSGSVLERQHTPASVQRPNGYVSPPLPSQVQASRSTISGSPASHRSGLDELNATIPAAKSYITNSALSSSAGWARAVHQQGGQSGRRSPSREPYAQGTYSTSASNPHPPLPAQPHPTAPTEVQQGKDDSYDPLGVGLG